MKLDHSLVRATCCVLPLGLQQFVWVSFCASFLSADSVEDYLSSEIPKRQIPGLAVAVLKDGEIVKDVAFGLANVELDVPATPKTIFQVQSITKTFTAAAILLLREEGRLSLDDPVSEYVDGTPASWNAINLRHLLSHTSGIKDFINDPTASLRLDVTDEEILQATARRPLDFTPGDRYAYSNTNYQLLAMIIRRTTGTWFGDFLAERIFTPLGMSDTRIVSLSEIIPGRASGYHASHGKLSNGDFVAESILSYGGGGVISTASDLARWAAALLSGKVLTDVTLAEAWTPVTLTNGQTSSYGLGWGVDTVAGHRRIGHSGGHVTGFASQLFIFPDDKLAVVVLANTNNANCGRIAQNVAGHFVAELAPRVLEPIEDQEPQVTALLRDCVLRAPEGRLDSEKFTPELWQRINAQISALQLVVRAVGQLKSVDLLSRGESNGVRTYRYRVTFARGKFDVTMSLDRGGKICEITSEQE